MLEIIEVKGILNSVIFLMMAVFCANKIDLKCKKIYAILIIFIWIYVPSIVLNVGFKNTNSFLRLCQNVISILIASKIVGQNTIKEYIKNIFILYGAVFVLEFVAQIYFVIVSNITNYEDSGIFDDTILSVISIAIIGLNSVIILMSYLVIKKNIKGKIKYQILLILIIIPLFNMILLTFLYIYNFENMKNTLELYSMFCLIISFIINVTIYEIILNLEKYHEQEKMFLILKEKEELLYNYYKLAVSNKEELRKLKHDMKNELQIAYSLIEDDNGREKAKLMLEKMKNNIENVSNFDTK